MSSSSQDSKCKWEGGSKKCPWNQYCQLLSCQKVEQIAAKILNEAFNRDKTNVNTL